MYKGVPTIFHWEQDRSSKADSGDGVLGEWAATPSHQLGSLGKRCELPCGVRGGVPTAQRFALFSTLRTTSPDTTILLIVDSCSHWGKTPVPLPLAYDYVMHNNYTQMIAVQETRLRPQSKSLASC